MIIEDSLKSYTLIVCLQSRRIIWGYFRTSNRIKNNKKRKLNKKMLMLSKNKIRSIIQSIYLIIKMLIILEIDKVFNWTVTTNKYLLIRLKMSRKMSNNRLISTLRVKLINSLIKRRT